MQVKVINETGYEEAALGFSLSYNTSIERTKEILTKYAFGVPGEGKFLESMIMYLDVTAPRFWWQEADTYRLTTKQSASTMHTLKKNKITNEMFEYPLAPPFLELLENTRLAHLGLIEAKRPPTFPELKSVIPEGFLQRRIWMISYKTLQGIYVQRINHRLPQWQYFLNTVINEIQHPEFIIKDYKHEVV
jgi:hypothetical protein